MNLNLEGIRYFEHLNKGGSCFICGSNDDEPCTLIGVDGTEEGRNEQAEQVHLRCLMDSKNWRINRELGAIYGRKAVFQKEKVCTRCQQTKPFDQFSLDRNSRDRLRSYCKSCTSALNRGSYLKKKEKNDVNT